MAIPAAAAAAVTSGSRTLPPGWATARTPAAARVSTPSGEGEKAAPPAAAAAAAGLGDGPAAGRGQGLDAVGEGEEGVAAGGGAPGAVAGLGDGDPDRVDPALLAGADPDHAAVAGQDDRVRLDVGGHPPGEGPAGPGA